MEKNGIFFDFQNPLWLLASAAGKKKLRKSMNLLDFIIADKNQSEKNSVKSEKTQEKLKKTQEFKLKSPKGAAFGC